MLGILAVNIAGFAGPTIGVYTPNEPHPGSPADQVAFAAMLLVFEGKMRALFTLLFGAGLVLYAERAEDYGRDGTALQLRRLGWLALFGFLHYILLWWGDILFLYAACGLAALSLRHAPVRQTAIGAVLAFTAWHAATVANDAPTVRAEEAVRMGAASAAQRQTVAEAASLRASATAREMAEYRAGWPEQVATKLRERPLRQVEVTLSSFGETLPLMLLGMALYHSGFFSGGWSRHSLRHTAAWGLGLGGAATLMVIAWAAPRGFPPLAMIAALEGWLAIPHLLMALGYAALLVLASARLTMTAIGRRIVAAGRMAFSNYLATSLVMCAIFYGWGLGLVGLIGTAPQFIVVALGWALMLGWSAPWLARFRHGPLEWAWRSLTNFRVEPLRW